MAYKTIKENDKVLVSLPERLDNSDLTEEIRNTILDLIEKGEKNLVLDLRNVEYVNSRTLAEILTIYRKVKEIDGELYLTKTTPRVQELIKVIMLDQLCKVYETA